MSDREMERHKRLRDALRENLKRRKSQARGRSDRPAETADGAAADADGIADDAEQATCKDHA